MIYVSCFPFINNITFALKWCFILARSNNNQSNKLTKTALLISNEYFNVAFAVIYCWFMNCVFNYQITHLMFMACKR